MDPYSYQQHSNPTSANRYQGSQSQQKPPASSSDQGALQPQQQLPSFKEILPPPLQSAIDSGSQYSNPADSGTHTSQQPTRIGGPGLPSPNYSQSSSMPEGFDEFGQRNQDPVYQIPQAQRQQQSLHPAQPYPDMATAYSTHRAPYPHMGMRHSPGLPPIRDIDQGMSKYNTYANSFVPTSNQYGIYSQEMPSNSGYYGGDSYGRRQPTMYESKNLSQQYPPSNRPYPPIKTGDQNYGQQISDPYSRAYDPPYYQSSAMSPTGTMPYSAASEAGDSRNRRRRGNLPKQITDILRAWFQDHLDNPYPSEEEKQMFIQQTGLSMNQISNWFINARRRHLPALRQARDSRNQETDSQRQSR